MIKSTPSKRGEAFWEGGLLLDRIPKWHQQFSISTNKQLFFFFLKEGNQQIWDIF